MWETKEPAVAFTTLVSKDTEVGTQGYVKYERLLTNKVGIYQSSTGVFIGQYDGIYSFL